MHRYTPKILPETPPPAAGQSCRQCELHQHGTRVVWGEGNPHSPLFVVLDNPGAREDKDGVPFLCGTRETMQKAAWEAGIKPGSIYVSYLLKCRPRKAYDKEKARASCIHYLWEQLKSAKPVLVMCLGNVVCQSFFQNPDARVKTLRGQVHSLSKGNAVYNIVTSYHPLAVRRRPALYKFFLQDWTLAASKLIKPSQ